MKRYNLIKSFIRWAFLIGACILTAHWLSCSWWQILLIYIIFGTLTTIYINWGKKYLDEKYEKTR